MIIVRDVYQAKYGKGTELVALLADFDKILAPVVGKATHSRVLSDASGPFFTIVHETEVESLAAWETLSKKIFASKEFEPWFSRWLALVESGHREFYNVER
jgi:hypothetical protein